ncbi:hypothetical protein CPB97_008726 [Podila verticillata]|nr:hypothetical protein CPB97_008726 [Podila verticillata]
MARQEADRCKTELSTLQAKLTPENFLTVARKVKKAQKHKIWEQKKIKEMQEYRDSTESRREKLHAEIDKKWARKLAREKEKAKLQSRQERTRLQKLKEAQVVLKEKKLLTLVQKLDQLRMLRRERLKREGHFFPEEDQEFYNRIQQQEQGLARQKKEQEECQETKNQAQKERVEARQQRMAQQKLKQQSQERGRVKKQQLKVPIPSTIAHATLLSPSSASQPPHKTQTPESSKVPPANIQMPGQEDCDRKGQAEVQLIRELWAQYVVDEDSSNGSCIPLDLEDPPPPSSHFWAVLLIK